MMPSALAFPAVCQRVSVFIVYACLLYFASLAFAAQAEENPHAAHMGNGTQPQMNMPEQPHMGMPTQSPADMSAQPAAPVTPPNSAKSGKPSPFTVNGTAPAGVTILSTQPSAPPPSIDEKLGSVVPDGIFLNDERGNPVDVRSLMDMPTIILPVFFTCPAACNTLQSSLTATLPNVTLTPGKDFRVITVSFDETDTPAMAARKKNNFLAAMNYEFPEEYWTYLTGDLASIKKFMDALGFPFIRKGVGDFSHPVGIIIVGNGGKITRYLYGQSFMPVDITMACLEAAEGKIGLSVKRVLSYCFAYDPEARGYVFSVMRLAGIIILFGAGVLLFVLLRGGKGARASSKRAKYASRHSPPPPTE